MRMHRFILELVVKHTKYTIRRTTALFVQANRFENDLHNAVGITIGARPTVLKVALAIVSDATRDTHRGSTVGNACQKSYLKFAAHI